MPKNKALISDTITMQNPPARPGASPAVTGGIEQQTFTVEAQLDREYTAGGYLSWYSQIARVLPWEVDDLAAQLGDDIYERMLTDSQVISCVAILKASILEDGVIVRPAIDDEEDPGFGRASDILDFCEQVLDDLIVPLDDVLWNMLDALAFGNKVAEQVYEVDSTYTGQKSLVLRALKVKPRRVTAFVVDSYSTVIGLLGLVPGVGYPVQVGTYLTNLSGQANLLPREKFAVLTFRPKDGDPRGVSLLRSAYDPWNAKVRLKPAFLKYLTQFASPSLVGVLAPGSVPTDAVDALGNPLFNVDGTRKQIKPSDAMTAALTSFQNSSVVTIPNGADVKPIEMTGEGASFLNAFDWYDRQIAKGILSQTLATEEGKHQARAAASVHQDVLGTIVRQAKKSVERMIRRDVLMPLVTHNFGDAARRLTPQVNLGTTEQQDMTGIFTAVASLQTSGYITDSQRPFFDEMMGAPSATPDELAEASAQPMPPPQDGDRTDGQKTPHDTTTMPSTAKGDT